MKAMERQKHPIELLAPAKDLHCGLEAVRHGADAVYIGAPRFSARAAAGNSVDDIRQLCDYAHLFGARVYVALNTLLKEEELAGVECLIRDLYAAGADALIIQDMAIARMDIPPIALHASTQTDNRTVEKVRFFEQEGFSQVVLARELPLERIREIAGQTSVALEAFVHGSLCVSYSGQCYLSCALAGRSANRGECAQLCRLPYTLEDAEGKVILRDKHLLSLRDLNRTDYLEALMDAGVSSFKIEGRLKDAAYVKNLTAWYRLRLDEILARRPEYRRASAGHSRFDFEPRPEKSFNRGFTAYYMEGRRSSDPVEAFDSPKSLGEAVGKVGVLDVHSFVLEDGQPLHNGDGLVFFDGLGHLQGFRANRVEGSRVFPQEMPPALASGRLLYRNYDQAFERLLSKPSAERKLSVWLRLVETSEGFRLGMKDETGVEVFAEMPFARQTARQPQAANIRRQLSKLGDTPFEAEAVDIDFSAEWFLPSSLLAELRRRASTLLEAERVRLCLAGRPQRLKPVQAAVYPARKLTYLGNVANSQAAAFYRERGVEEIEPAFELAPQVGVPLMYTAHCLRYSLGCCPKYQKKPAPWHEPLYLVHKQGRLRLTFDCANCRMLVEEAI
jgi:putative protease